MTEDEEPDTTMFVLTLAENQSHVWIANEVTTIAQFDFLIDHLSAMTEYVKALRKAKHAH